VLEAIHTQRAVRRLTPDPVPGEPIWRILEAATRAPSGGNFQPWSFIVIRGPQNKRRVAKYYLDGYRQA
jgi:nitroreductase